jgi:hypothetical protein
VEGGVFVLLSPSHLGLNLFDLKAPKKNMVSGGRGSKKGHDTNLFNGGRHFGGLATQRLKQKM